MAIEIPAVDATRDEAADARAQAAQPWPRPLVAWYAVAVFGIVLMFGQLEQSVISFLITPIKNDFSLRDWEVSLLVGIAPSIFYAAIGLPMARLVDTMRRNVVMAVMLSLGGAMTAISGLAQGFWQFAVCRVLVGGGGAIQGPGTYSMMADYFPREKLPRAIAFMQIGFISGRGLSLVFGGLLAGLVASWPIYHLGPLLIRNWQWVFIVVGVAGALGAVLFLTVPEPARRGRFVTEPGKGMTIGQVLAYLATHWKLYLPQFLALAFSAVETYGNESWRVVFLQRTYGWTPQQAGLVMGPMTIGAQLLGLVVGTWVTQRLAKKHDDANLRAVAIFYSCVPLFAVIGPLMPNPWLSIICSSLVGLFGLAGAVPQNAALQSVTPNEMRGQITALYLFVFSVIGLGMGPSFMAAITDFIVRDENLIRFSMAGSAAIMTPLAALIMWSGLRAYGKAIGEIKAREAAAGAG